MASGQGDKLFLLGGFAGQEMDDIYVYDLKSKQWNLLGDVKLPVPRSVCVSGSIKVRKKFKMIFCLYPKLHYTHILLYILYIYDANGYFS